MQDVIIVGGSFAGLTAALQLGRASRSVTVLDTGAPRNRRSPAAHGVPGRDGQTPAEILGAFAADVRAYPTVSLRTAEAREISGALDGFAVSLGTGETLRARRILLAHGVRDALPDIPGCRDLWGTALLHCPYCHGFELRGRPLAVLANHAMSGHQARLLRTDWSDDVTMLTGIEGDFSPAGFAADGLTMEPRRVAGLTPAPEGLSVRFEDGGTRAFAGAFVAPRASLDGTPAEALGCALADGPLGPFIEVGPMGQTSVPGVFAAGDCARPAHSVTLAMGDGATAGTGCHQSLVFPDMIEPVKAAA